MEEFLNYVIRQLIEYPDEMMISHQETPKKVTFTVRLRPSDVGRVIGRHGHTIAALRNLLNAAAARHGRRANLQVVG